MQISKEFRFEAAHQLPADQECTYGVCSRLHGHSYRIVAFVSGDLGEDGWIMNFKDIGKVVEEVIIKKCDHQFLNDIYPGMITTAENMGKLWAAQINPTLVWNYGCHLVRLEVWETAKCCAIVEASDIPPDVPSTPTPVKP